MVFKNNKQNPPVALTAWYFSTKDKGWKQGMRVVRWDGEDRDKIQFQRHRTNKIGVWKPDGRQYYFVRMDWFLELFNPKNKIVDKMLLEYRRTKEETKEPKKTDSFNSTIRGVSD